jgi:hypothetical protein
VKVQNELFSSKVFKILKKPKISGAHRRVLLVLFLGVGWKRGTTGMD